MADVHPTAAAGFAAAADQYERHRPGYPAAAVEALTIGLGLRPGVVVLDLAAGTGKLTQALVASGAQIVAIEPVDAMRQLLTARLPSVAVMGGMAEAIPLPDGVLDAATVGQAFHWFDGPRALAELRRTLVPGGRAGIIFNRRAVETPVQGAIDRLLEPYRRDTPSWADEAWQTALDDARGFRVAGPERVPHEQLVDIDGLIGRVMSVSFVAMLDHATQQAIQAGVRDVFAREQRDGRVMLPYETWLWVLHRQP